MIHLAARVGGIGANQRRPSDLYLDNLLMGTYVLEEARRRETPKTVMVGTICSYPKFTEVPFQEDVAVDRLPGGDQRAVRHRQAGPAGAAPGQPRPVRPVRDLPDAHQPLRPGRQVPPRRLPRHPRAHQEGGRGQGVGRRPHRGVGDGLGQPRVPLRRRRGPGHRARRRALRRARARSTWAPTRSCPSATSSGWWSRRSGFEGEIRWDTTKPDGQPRRRVDPSRARERFGFVAEVPFDEGLRRTVDWYLAHRAEAEARAT